MTALAFAGAGVGLGLWLVTLALRARPTLTEVGSRLESESRTSVPELDRRSPLEEAVVESGGRFLRGLGMDPDHRATDLRVMGRTPEQHIAAKLAWTGGLSFVGLLMGLTFLTGIAGWLGLVIGLVGGAVLGLYVPELLLTGQAEEARDAFRHAYSGYLDLVNVMLAAGAGPESALQSAAESGDGWAFAEIREALESARRTRMSVPEAFAALGEDLGVIELEELAGSMQLVGRQGARVRETLASKADALRRQQMAETEAQAEAATERMTLPVALLLAGFLLMLLYPAVMLIVESAQGST